MDQPPAAQRTWSSPELADVVAQLAACSERARAVCAGLGPDGLRRRAQPELWSIAECLEHLNLTTRAYLPILDAARDEAQQRGLAARGRMRLDVKGWLLAKSLEPPARFTRMRTKPAFVPLAIEPVERVLPSFLALNADLAQRIVAFDGFAIDRVLVRSPFEQRMRYSAWSALVVIAAHERRHLWQAERVRAAIG